MNKQQETRTEALPREYPVTPPSVADDERFTIGLVIDIIDVLEKHGYPRVRRGGDMVDLQQALFRFLYIAEDR